MLTERGEYAMKMRLIALTTVICFLCAGCSSTTLIKSSPEGAKLYLDAQYKCVTPCSHTDTAAAGTSRAVLLKKEGFKDFAGTIKKEEVKIGPIIGGIFFLFPFIWMLGYPDEYTFELERISVSAPAEPSSSSTPAKLPEGSGNGGNP
jgi:hypothetical protein